jgi:hypothetical protein
LPTLQHTARLAADLDPEVHEFAVQGDVVLALTLKEVGGWRTGQDLQDRLAPHAPRIHGERPAQIERARAEATQRKVSRQVLPAVRGTMTVLATLERHGRSSANTALLPTASLSRVGQPTAHVFGRYLGNHDVERRAPVFVDKARRRVRVAGDVMALDVGRAALVGPQRVVLALGPAAVSAAPRAARSVLLLAQRAYDTRRCTRVSA